MKRAGAISTRLGVHADTIRDWADSFEEFLSEGAKKGAGVRRIFTLEDEIVLNTICELRKLNTEFEEIRARLRNGERIEFLPSVSEPIPPETSLEVYGRILTLETLIEQKDAEIERLRAELITERERTDRIMQSPQTEIIELNRKIAVLEYQLEQLKRKNQDDE